MLGEALALVAVFCFAIANVAVAKASQKAGGDRGAFLSVILTTVLAAVLWLVLPAGADFATHEAPWQGVFWFALAGLLATVVGRATLFRSIALAGAINAGVFRRIIPLSAAAFAFVVLGESLSLPGAAGMTLIVISIVAVIRSAKSGEGRGGATIAADRSSLLSGQIYGSVSATAYGAAYVTRKLGMLGLPNAALGALISSATALAAYGLMAAVSAGGRRAIVAALRHTDGYQVVAASGLAFGQTAQFFAIKYTSVTVVAIIGSLEMFVSAYLAVFIFRTEGWPPPIVVAASLLATAGALLVALN